MATVSGGTSSERFGFIERFGGELGIRYLCQWLQVSPSGYYAWLKRKPSKRTMEDKRLLSFIEHQYRKVVVPMDVRESSMRLNDKEFELAENVSSESCVKRGYVRD